MKRTTLLLNDYRLQELKRLAAERGQTIFALVDEFVADGIRRARSAKAATVGGERKADFSNVVGQWTPDPGLDKTLASQRQIDWEKWD